MAADKNYPRVLYNALVAYGVQPTGDLDWDRAWYATLRQKAASAAAVERTRLSAINAQAEAERSKRRACFPDLRDEGVYRAHADEFLWLTNEIVLRPQRRRFEIDEHNKDVLRFLLYYFNECPLAEEVFPGRGYKLHKNLLLMGKAGAGKTLLLDAFSLYLRYTDNPRQFESVSSTEMVNYFRIHNHIDRFTYNSLSSGKGYHPKPFDICLHDLGVETVKFYGEDVVGVAGDFLYARNEIWANPAEFDRKFTHITTNLTIDDLTAKFSAKDAYGRLIDRFKTYNIIPLTGESRR